MRKFVLPAAIALALVSAPAVAADLGRMPAKAPLMVAAVNPWDIAFGAAIATDYNFRGISQSDRGFSPYAYFEPRYNASKTLQFYAGIAGYGVNLPTNPSAEIDLYFGVRPTFGPFGFDFGFLYYYYPKEMQFNGVTNIYANGSTTLANTDFWEVYGKVTYTINDTLSVGGNVYYSPSWLNTGADGTFASATFKWVTPWKWGDVGTFISGEVGHYWLGTPDIDGVLFTAANLVNLPDYTTWNIGLAFTYRVFTLDLRYYDTDLSKESCWVLTSDPGATFGGAVSMGNPTGLRSKWCDPAFVAKLAFDMTLDSLK